MSDLIYKLIVFEDDNDINNIKGIHKIPEIAQYISISDNYFHYVTTTNDVYFYKVYKGSELVGTIHLEKPTKTLYMDIIVFPTFQKTGIGTKIIRDVQNDIFELNYDLIEVFIDENNIASKRLFEKTGFNFISKEDELSIYAYKCN